MRSLLRFRHDKRPKDCTAYNVAMVKVNLKESDQSVVSKGVELLKLRLLKKECTWSRVKLRGAGADSPSPQNLYSVDHCSMDSPNISELNDFHSGSRLLSEPSLSHDSSSGLSGTGPGGNDLSLSELSLSDRPQPGPSRKPKFSLLAQPLHQDDLSDGSAVADGDYDPDATEQLDETMTQEDVEKARKLASRTREEKLQHDLFILKKLNSAFDVYKEALRETKSSTEVSIDLHALQRRVD